MQEVQPLLTHLARRLQGMLPCLDVDELVGDAQRIALLAIRTHDGSADVKTWVYRHVRMYFSYQSRNKTWVRRHSKQTILPPIPQTGKSRFDLRSFLFDLSREAGETVRVAIRCDEDLSRPRGTLSSRLVRVLRTLAVDFGWEKDLIVKVFAEIKEAL